MSHPRVAAYARLADGNVNPVRVIEGQEAKLARALHGIVYDRVHDEIIAPNPFAEAILFFRGGVDGEEAPIRIIQGPHTQLDGGPDWNTPDSVAYDPAYDEVYTRLRRGRGADATPAILVFPRTGNGDVAPVRVLRGPKTLLNDPYRIAVDGENNMLVIANREPRGFLIFNRDDSGDVAPKAIISGPNTGLFGTPQQIQMDPERRQFIAAIPGRRSEEGYTQNGFVGVWNYTDNGDVAPKAVIRGSDTMMISPRGLDINPRDKEIYVADRARNMLLTFRAPHIFGE
ncbi:hypothetical protein MYX82_02650 [Acidobacteria bacterium AH-259-D05]|nr:hypothetical protein [Acidobacteria bacterium AH-259-D05]